MIPALEGRADDLVGAGFDNGYVGHTGVRRADVDCHGNHLTSRVGEDLAGIGEWNALALPDAAVGMATLKVLDGALHIAVMVRVLVVEDLVSAVGFETVAGQTWLRAGNVAVSSDRGDEARKSDGRVGLHSDNDVVDEL